MCIKDILDLYFQFTIDLLGHDPVVSQGASVSLIPLPGQNVLFPLWSIILPKKPLNVAGEKEAAEQGTLQFREKGMSTFLLQDKCMVR